MIGESNNIPSEDSANESKKLGIKCDCGTNQKLSGECSYVKQIERISGENMSQNVSSPREELWKQDTEWKRNSDRKTPPGRSSQCTLRSLRVYATDKVSDKKWGDLGRQALIPSSVVAENTFGRILKFEGEIKCQVCYGDQRI
ncbi:hypothetical protein ACTXT7_013581 [Hymenolepis weldensis]